MKFALNCALKKHLFDQSIWRRLVFRIISLIFLLCVYSSQAQVLEPESSCFVDDCGYQEILRSKFGFQMKKDLLLVAVVIPPFSPEYVVGIQFKNGRYQMIAIFAKQRIEGVYLLQLHERKKNENHSIFMSEEEYQLLKKISPNSLADIEMEEKAEELSGESAKVFLEIWRDELVGVSYPERKLPKIDGIQYHLSILSGGIGVMSGMATFDSPNGKDSVLPRIVSFMVEFSVGKISEDRLMNQVKESTQK